MHRSARRTWRGIGALGTFLALTGSVAAYERDPGFGGGDGIATADGPGGLSLNYSDIEVLSDGKVLASGWTSTPAGGRDFMLARHNLDGSLDTGFGGGDGMVTTDISGAASDDLAFALDVEADGQIVLAGEATANAIDAEPNVAIARYNPDGSLDADGESHTGFGGDGIVQLNGFTPGEESAFDVLSDASERIIAVGTVYIPATDEYDVLAARMTPAGGFDSTFDGEGAGGDGIFRLDFTGPVGDDEATAVELLDDGDIAVGGFGAPESDGDYDGLLLRLNSADGTFDDGFSTDGVIRSDSANRTNDLAVSSGKILAVGRTDGFGDFILERYTQADGEPDTAFGGGTGFVMTSFPGQSGSGATDVTIDGARYVVSGSVSVPAPNDETDDAIGVARYTSAGDLDGLFSGDGLLMTNLAPVAGAETPGSVGIYDDGNALTQNKVVVGGTLRLGDPDLVARDGLLLRYGPDESEPSSEIKRPKHRKTYTWKRVRTFAGTSLDPRDGDVDEVEIALRRRSASGLCGWWDSDSFEPGACNAPLFVETGGEESWSYEPLSKLKPSVGTNIKDYTLYSRATDGSGNLETSFETGRNANRFEVD